MNRASSATGWVRNPVMKLPELDPALASSYELGWTFNPITGCLNGCEYCYARKLANGRLKSRYLANNNLAPTMGEGVTPYNTSRLIDSITPFYPRFWEDRLELPFSKLPTMRNWSAIAWAAIANSKRRGIFVCDMSDLFGIGIPEDWTRRVLDEIRKHENDRFYLLTKQPQNLIKFSPFPPHVWVGVTATNTKMFHNACYYLASIEASVKYLSLEPFLEWEDDGYQGSRMVAAGIKQVIIGAQTKPTVYPKIEWVQKIALACTKAHIPLFIKDNLKPLLPNRMPFWGGVAWTEIDKGVPIRMSENKLRQEIPVCQNPQ